MKPALRVALMFLATAAAFAGGLLAERHQEGAGHGGPLDAPSAVSRPAAF